MIKLYTYFRASGAYRARITLNLKGLAHELEYLDLAGGRQEDPAYIKLNPQKLVPTLLVDGHVLTQSLAIIEYLDETRPNPAFLPADAFGRARVRAIALAIACEMHPLNNLRVLNFLTGELGLSEAAKLQWYRHWIREGLTAVESMVAGHPDTGRFCHGDQPGLADICLIPQLYNARRYECDIEPYPTLRRIETACGELTAFADAHPARQRDAI
jgi:maleylacetoacetate isomerase